MDSRGNKDSETAKEGQVPETSYATPQKNGKRGGTGEDKQTNVPQVRCRETHVT